MSTTKINFTADHKARLEALALIFLFSGDVIKGFVGQDYNVHDLLHNLNLGTLSQIHVNLKKEIDKIENLDQWSLTDYQQRKLEKTKLQQEFVNLLIGYKKDKEQKNADRAKLRELMAKKKELEASTLTPEQQLKALNDEITALGGESLVDEAAGLERV